MIKFRMSLCFNTSLLKVGNILHMVIKPNKMLVNRLFSEVLHLKAYTKASEALSKFQ